MRSGPPWPKRLRLWSHSGFIGNSTKFEPELGLDGRQGSCDVLLIDEGFGSLDSDSLDLALEALETLQDFGRKVGVVTHVAGLVERMPTQVSADKRGGGRSDVEVQEA